MTAVTVPGTPARLQQRARRLRAEAASVHPVLAAAYVRRAAELELDALIEAIWNPPVDLGDGPPPGLPEMPATDRRAA
ncbi:MAG TPA: hypothetical protein VIL48_19470 [Acidimicrobiales bacterium]